jgi:hypothetical protein
MSPREGTTNDFASIGRSRPRAFVAAAAFTLIGACVGPAWAYQACPTITPEGTVNNVAPVPTGEVDNLADQVSVLAFPSTGIVGPSNSPVLNDRGVLGPFDWSPVSWKEPTRNCKISRHQFDFWPPATYQEVPDGVVYPTIVYFHPNRADFHFEEGSPIDLQVAAPAHELGYHFISVEFRHPVADEYLAQLQSYGGQVPHGDVGLFIRFVREHAAQMKVDTRNIFVFGHSRGALALWQALQPDVQGQTSHQVAGFVGYQAQTSYGCDVFSQRYLVQDTDTAAFVQQCHVDHSHDAQFGDAVASVRGGLSNPTKLPVMLQYEKGLLPGAG